MSYLHLPSINMADFHKGTISLWFRFSQDAVQSAQLYNANYQPPDPDAPEIFRSTIPLITFGRKVMAHMYDSVDVIVGTTPPSFDPSGNVIPGEPVMATHTVEKGVAPCEPSHIGIDVSGDDVVLKMFFQMETRAQVQGLNGQIVEVHFEVDPISGLYQRYDTVEDISYIRTGQPESFLIKPKFKIETDQWHHLLVSFDFSGPVDVVAAEVEDTSTFDEDSELIATVKSFCKLWYAFDDENRNGKDNIGHGWVPQDANGIVTQTAKDAAFVYTPVPPDPFVTGGNENPEYHRAASPMPMNAGPVGLPASAEYVQTIYHCEMAELQFFSDLVFDTNDLSRRRAFVDADGKPVDPAETETILGQRPAILLHGSGNWKTGYNTGSVGVEIDTNGEKTSLPGGQFTPVAKIAKYKPEPVLTETPTA
jgi:hypothetical protein